MNRTMVSADKESAFKKAIKPDEATGYRWEHTSSAGMSEHGWTKAAIVKFLGEPDKFAENPHYKRGPSMRLYRVVRVLAAQNSVEFGEWLVRKERRKQKSLTAPQRRYEKFAAKYDSWLAALADGCGYLFDLNRYAKNTSCADENRRDIYRLKSGILELLYREGYCTEYFEHHHELPALACFGCDGTGNWIGCSDYDGVDLAEECRRCDGTGQYRKPKTLRFVCFRFNIAGISYCWHQPKTSVSFAYALTAEDVTWTPNDPEDKPITLNRAKFAEAKDLLRWILDQAANPVPIAA